MTFDGNVITWKVGDLAPGATGSVSVVVQALEAGKFNNTAVITCNETENKTNNSTEVDVLYVELAINKTADPSTVYVGQEITFTIAYANNGNGTAHNATVTDEIDTDVFKIISYGDGTLDGNVITWKVGDLSWCYRKCFCCSSSFE